MRHVVSRNGIILKEEVIENRPAEIESALLQSEQSGVISNTFTDVMSGVECDTGNLAEVTTASDNGSVNMSADYDAAPTGGNGITSLLFVPISQTTDGEWKWEGIQIAATDAEYVKTEDVSDQELLNYVNQLLQDPPAETQSTLQRSEQSRALLNTFNEIMSGVETDTGTSAGVTIASDNENGVSVNMSADYDAASPEENFDLTSLLYPTNPTTAVWQLPTKIAATEAESIKNEDVSDQELLNYGNQLLQEKCIFKSTAELLVKRQTQLHVENSKLMAVACQAGLEEFLQRHCGEFTLPQSMRLGYGDTYGPPVGLIPTVYPSIPHFVDKNAPNQLQ